MAPVSKDDLLNAIDYEVESVTERHKLEGVTLWVTSVAIVGALAGAGVVFEAGALRWSNVGKLVLVFVLIGDVVATLINASRPTASAQARLPIALWKDPFVAVVLQQLILLLVALYARNGVSTWAIGLAVVVFGHSILMLGLYVFVQRVGFKRSGYFQKTWSSNSVSGFSRGAKYGWTIARWIEPLLYVALAIAYARAAYQPTMGAPLTDIKFAALTFIVMSLVGVAMMPRVTPLLFALTELRRAVALNTITPADGQAAFAATLSGIYGANALITWCRTTITSLAAVRSEADAALLQLNQVPASKPSIDVNILQAKLAANLENAQHVWTVAQADVAVQNAIRPAAVPLLMPILAELSAEAETFEASRTALLTALSALPSESSEPADA